MQIVIQIPDEKSEQVLTGLAVASGWTSASGVSVETHVKAAIISHIKQTAKAGLVRQAMLTAAAEIDPVVIS
jgi:hypothetical protein